MREQEQIEAILRKLEEREPNMRSTRIVISILRCLLTLTPNPNLMVAWVYTTLIELVAHQLAKDPKNGSTRDALASHVSITTSQRKNCLQVTSLGGFQLTCVKH